MNLRYLQKDFKEKHKIGEILFQERVVSINDLPFSKHNEKGKGQVMIASHAEVEVKGDEAHNLRVS